MFSRRKPLLMAALLLGAGVSFGLLSLDAQAQDAKDSASPEKPITGDSENELTALIDREIKKVWERDGVTPSGKSSDEEFLRRVYFDTLGVPPSYEEAAAFYKDDDKAKREKLIDKLVADERFGRHIADQWSIIIMGRGERDRGQGSVLLAQWISERINAGKGFDSIVYDVATASGKLADNPAVAAYLAAGGNAFKPADMTGNLMKYFTGVQIQCAQCHKHPYEKWNEADFAGVASFFATLDVRLNNRSVPLNPGVEMNRPLPPRIAEAVRKGEKVPDEVKARMEDQLKFNKPKILGGNEVKTTDRAIWRAILAKWLIAPDNKQSHRYMANRIWSFAFGQGILNPVDDFNSFTTPSHPELLEALAADFGTHGWDIKRLYRAMLKSNTWQLSSKPASGKKVENWHFASYPVRQLTPEQFMGSLVTIAGSDELGRMFKRTANPFDQIRRRYEQLKKDEGKEKKKEEGGNDNMRDYSFDEDALKKFEAQFEKVPGDWYMRRILASRFATASSDDEMQEADNFSQTIDQALAVMNGEVTNRLSGSGRGTPIGRIFEIAKDDESRVEALYLMIFSRKPGARETSRAVSYIRNERGSPKAWEDVLFAMLATTEFATNH